MSRDEEQTHWLVRPTTLRKLWIGFIAVLVLVVLAQSVIYIKGYFGIDAWFGFGAIYGFGCCLLMVLVAKLLGVVLKRPSDYYANGDDLSHQQDTIDPDSSRIEERNDGA